MTAKIGLRYVSVAGGPNIAIGVGEAKGGGRGVAQVGRGSSFTAAENAFSVLGRA